MPTNACRPEQTAEDGNDERCPQGREDADSLAGCPSGCLPPSARRCRIPDMQEWLDLCA
jgi:hypothetical protein